MLYMPDGGGRGLLARRGLCQVWSATDDARCPRGDRETPSGGGLTSHRSRRDKKIAAKAGGSERSDVRPRRADAGVKAGTAMTNEAGS